MRLLIAPDAIQGIRNKLGRSFSFPKLQDSDVNPNLEPVDQINHSRNAGCSTLRVEDVAMLGNDPSAELLIVGLGNELGIVQ
ncbi:hypothetical protein D3C86_1888470 [compost metagenome]